MLRQKDGDPLLTNSPPLRASSGNPMGEGPEISLLTGTHIAPFEDRPLKPCLPLDACIDDFGLSADIISGGLGPASLVSDNAMFTSSTAAPLPIHPIGLGLSDTPSMAAYITTGSPGVDTNNSQLVWKQSANLPDPDLLKHLYEVAFLPYRCTWIYIVFAGLTFSSLAILMQTDFYTDRRSFCKQFSFPASQLLINRCDRQYSLTATDPPEVPPCRPFTCYLCSSQRLYTCSIQP